MAIYQDQYTPYFYIIQDKRNGMYYAGAKWAKDANPVAFMIEGGYTTSSNTINELIHKHGLQHFVVRKIRTFETGSEAYRYETRFLQRVDARNNPSFYNGHNNDGIMNPETSKITMIKLHGVDHNTKLPGWAEKRKTTIENKWGSIRDMIKETNAAEKSFETHEKRYGFRYALRSDYVINKIEQTCMERYGVKNPFQSKELQLKMREKGRKTFAKNYDERQIQIIEEILQSEIDFSKYGWASKVAKIVGISPQKVGKWMKRNMPDFYAERCFVRNS